MHLKERELISLCEGRETSENAYLWHRSGNESENNMQRQLQRFSGFFQPKNETTRKKEGLFVFFTGRIMYILRRIKR